MRTIQGLTRYRQISSDASETSRTQVVGNASVRGGCSFSPSRRDVLSGLVSVWASGCQVHSKAADDVVASERGADGTAEPEHWATPTDSTPLPATFRGSSTTSTSTLPSRKAMRLATYHVDSPTFGRLPAVVRVPEHDSSAALPVLFLLHGRGEALKTPERGARGFLDDYALEHNWRWLDAPEHSPPKDTPMAFQRTVRAQLAERAFGGMVVVMPYVPDRFRGPEVFGNAGEYARVLGEFAQRVKADLPVRQDRNGWALDGISLGGRVAMACAPDLADQLGAVGSVQAAIDERELTQFAKLLEQARRRNPTLKVTLATSEHDYFRSVLERYHGVLSERHFSHDWLVLPGDHSYAFNRDVGVAHLLLTYDRWFAGSAR